MAAARNPSQQTRLPLEPWRLIDHESVEDVLLVERLHPIALVDIERIVQRQCAGRLCHSIRAQRLAVGEILVQRQAVKVGNLERNKAAVIVAETIRRRKADAAADLDV